MRCRQQRRRRRRSSATARALCRRAVGAERLPGQRVDAEGPVPRCCVSRDGRIADVCGVSASAAHSASPCCQRSQLPLLVTRSQSLRQGATGVCYTTAAASLSQSLGWDLPMPLRKLSCTLCSGCASHACRRKTCRRRSSLKRGTARDRSPAPCTRAALAWRAPGWRFHLC